MGDGGWAVSIACGLLVTWMVSLLFNQMVATLMLIGCVQRCPCSDPCCSPLCALSGAFMCSASNIEIYHSVLCARRPVQHLCQCNRQYMAENWSVVFGIGVGFLGSTCAGTCCTVYASKVYLPLCDLLVMIWLQLTVCISVACQAISCLAVAEPV